MGNRANVVDEENVDLGEAEALLAVLHRAHDAIVGIVVVDGEGERLDPGVAIDFAALVGAQQTADLGREHDALATVTQGIANEVFGAAETVLRGGVDEGESGFDAGGDGGARLLVGDFEEDAGDGRCAEGELSDREPRLANLSFADSHASLPGKRGGH